MRINRLRKSLEEKGIDAFLVTNTSNIRYISGFTGSSGALVILHDEAFLITDSRYIEQAKNETDGFEIIKCKNNVLTEVIAICKKTEIKTFGFEKDYMTVSGYEEMVKDLPKDIVVEGCEEVIESLREIKDESEIDLLKKAAAIADKAFEHLIKIIRPGVSERDIGIELEYFIVKHGSANVSFNTVVASGERGALPHGVASQKKIEKGEVITCDFGPVFHGYCADITRTVGLGEVNGKIIEIYRIVQEAQKAAKEGIKSGIRFNEADKIARDIITNAGYGSYFEHGLGHGTGLNVHERPYLTPRKKGVLKPNMVVTIEPGIYMPGVGGVRIEDMAIIGVDSSEIITKSTNELIIID